MSELKMDKGMALSLYNGPEDLMNFKITVTPDDGMYKRGVFVFDFKVPKTYPHDPPKVQCETTVFHPNIDMEGHVCLNILREDWKPVLTIQSVIMGLQALRPPAPRPRHLGLCTSAPLRPSGPLHLCTSPRCSSASLPLCPAGPRRTAAEASQLAGVVVFVPRGRLAVPRDDCGGQMVSR